MSRISSHSEKPIVNIHPPISSRSTDSLIEVIRNPEDWTEEVSILAESELIKRGYTRGKLHMILQIHKNFVRRSMRVKNNAEYKAHEKLFLFLVGPIAILLLRRPGAFSKSSDFVKMNTQRRWLLTGGFLLWSTIVLGLLQL